MNLPKKTPILHMIMLKALLIAGLISTVSFRGLSQSKAPFQKTSGPSLRFEQISIETGLSQSWVWSIVQDRKGFMWIGTKDGLNKYDGYKFTVYKHDRENRESLSDNIVTVIFEDSRGELWVGTEAGGLNRFDSERESFRAYRHDPENDSSISSSSITSILEDGSGVLWIGTSSGLNRFHRNTETFSRFTPQPLDPQNVNDNWINTVYEDRFGILWIGSRGGLDSFDRQKGVFHRFPLPPQGERGNSAVTSVHEDRNGRLWIGTWMGLHIFDREREQYARILYGLVTAILEDDWNTLWITTSGNGLFRYNPVTAELENFQTDFGNPNSIHSNLLTAAYRDQSGLLWFGTKSHGVVKHDPRTEHFGHYRNQPWNPNSLSDNYVRTFLEADNGDIWIGTGTGGLNRYVRGHEIFHRFSHDASRPNTLSHSDVINIKEDRHGALWIGTGGGGLNRFDKKNTFKRYFPNNSTTVNDNVIYALCFDSSGALWIGTWGGLNRLDPVSGTFRHYQHEAENAKSLSDDFVRTIYVDRSGTVWIGTNLGGLNKYDPVNDAFVRFQHEPDDPRSISHNTIECLYEDKTGNFWIGTFGGGLNLFDRESGECEHFSQKDGLPNDVVHGILEDDHNNLWLSTNNGLSRFDPAARTFKNYYHGDGLQSNEFTTNAYYKTRAGEMIFGGINGFNIFHPDSITDNPFLPPVVITDFQLFNKRVLPGTPDGDGTIILEKPIPETDQLSLSYHDYVFSFEFAALDFTNPERNQYQYRMEEFDKDWIHSGSRRFVTYTNLDPGEYTFRVRGSNNDGVWNDAGTSVSIIIAPPFWKTWWFRTFSIVMIVGASFVLHRRRVRTIESRKRELEVQVQEKSEAARKIQEALSEVERLRSRLEAENIYLQDEIKLSHNFENIISTSESMKKIFFSIEQVAATTTSILILGETGTGKELIARSIHSLSPRRNKPLIKVNCAALPATLIESELFGHEKGAFTGAYSRKTGRFELADGGTIFLDEIGDLPLDLQTKLLRVLQEGQFERLGGSTTLTVDVRVISATNRNLRRSILEGGFREDLFYRLNVFPIVIPPLRERKEDIPLLVKHFVQKHSGKIGKSIVTVPPASMEKLIQYDWPGNVRELENVIERSVVAARMDELRIDESVFEMPLPMAGHSLQTLEEHERKYIVQVLESTGWRISGEKGAAKILGLKPTTLEFRMKKLGIKKP